MGEFIQVTEEQAEVIKQAKPKFGNNILGEAGKTADGRLIYPISVLDNFAQYFEGCEHVEINDEDLPIQPEII